MTRHAPKPLPKPERLFVKPAIYKKTKKPFVIRDPRTMRKIPPYGARVLDSTEIQRHLRDKTLLLTKEANVKKGAEEAAKNAATDAEDANAKAQAEAEKAQKAAAEAKAKADAEAAKKAEADAKAESTGPGKS